MEEDNRDADCKYVMERRRSPPEVSIKVEMTSGLTSICSALAM